MSSNLVPVKVFVYIKNIFGIDELDLSLKMRVKITMEWFDHRLTFRNLRDGQDENIVPIEVLKQLWLPYLIFADSNLGTFASFNLKLFKVNKTENPFFMEAIFRAVKLSMKVSQIFF